MAYKMIQPCDNCPFRTDVAPYLTKARVRELDRALVQSEFYCHKTTEWTDEEDEDGFYWPKGEEQHCAGALILNEKQNRPSQMMRIAERLGLYHRDRLKMDAPVFDTWKAMIKAQPH